MEQFVTKKYLNAALEQQRREFNSLVDSIGNNSTMSYQLERLRAIMTYAHSLDCTQDSPQTKPLQPQTRELEIDKDWVFGG